MDVIGDWLDRYDWFNGLPIRWKQAAHRVVLDVGAERFVGLTAVHEALRAKDLVALWDALEDEPVTDRSVDMIEMLVNTEKNA